MIVLGPRHSGKHPTHQGTQCGPSTPHIFAAVVKIFDKSITAVYADLKQSHVQLSTFLTLRESVVALGCDSSDIARVVLHSSDLTACSAAACRLVNGSSLGSQMVSDKMVLISAKRYSDEIDAALAELNTAGKITIGIHQRVTEACETIASNIIDAKTSSRSRTVNIKFLGVDVPIVCADLKAEYVYKFAPPF